MPYPDFVYAKEAAVLLFIEYDVHPSGEIELVALINAVEEDGQDPDGAAWLTWRSSGIRRRRLGLRGRAPG